MLLESVMLKRLAIISNICRRALYPRRVPVSNPPPFEGTIVRYQVVTVKILLQQGEEVGLTGSVYIKRGPPPVATISIMKHGTVTRSILREIWTDSWEKRQTAVLLLHQGHRHNFHRLPRLCHTAHWSSALDPSRSEWKNCFLCLKVVSFKWIVL